MYSRYQSLEERLWPRVDKSGECWVWTGHRVGRSDQHYGSIKVNGRQRRVHRVAYELLVGPIPDGMELDHLCRNHRCVNPAHLQPVSRRENIMRGVGVGAVHAKKTHCPAGHGYTEKNTRVYRGHRYCRECDRIRSVAKNRRRRGKVAS